MRHINKTAIRFFLTIVMAGVFLILQPIFSLAADGKDLDQVLKEIEEIAKIDPELAREMKGEYEKSLIKGEITRDHDDSYELPLQEIPFDLTTDKGREEAIQKIKEDFNSGKSGLTESEYKEVVEAIQNGAKEEDLREIFDKGYSADHDLAIKEAQEKYNELIKSGMDHDKAAEQVAKDMEGRFDHDNDYDLTTEKGTEQAMREFEKSRGEMEKFGWSKEDLDRMQDAIARGDNEAIRDVMRDYEREQRERYREMGHDAAIEDMERGMGREMTDEERRGAIEWIERDVSRDTAERYAHDTDREPTGAERYEGMDRESAIADMERNMDRPMTDEERRMAEEWLNHQ